MNVSFSLNSLLNCMLNFAFKQFNDILLTFILLQDMINLHQTV